MWYEFCNWFWIFVSFGLWKPFHMTLGWLGLVYSMGIYTLYTNIYVHLFIVYKTYTYNMHTKNIYVYEYNVHCIHAWCETGGKTRVELRDCQHRPCADNQYNGNVCIYSRTQNIYMYCISMCTMFTVYKSCMRDWWQEKGGTESEDWPNLGFPY